MSNIPTVPVNSSGSSSLSNRDSANLIPNIPPDETLRSQSIMPSGETSLIILALHDMGENPNSVVDNLENLRKTIKSIRQFWFWELQLNIRVQFIDWKSIVVSKHVTLFNSTLNPAEGTNDTQQSITPFQKSLLADLLLYFHTSSADEIVESIRNELNSTVDRITQSHGGKYSNAKIILIGHGIGGLLLYEILSGIKLRTDNSNQIQENKLNFNVDSLFLIGCPLGPFSMLYSKEKQLKLPSGTRIYNLFFPKDPYACRLEALHYFSLKHLPTPVTLPHWKTNENFTRSSKSKKNSEATAPAKSTISVRHLFSREIKTEKDANSSNSQNTTSAKPKGALHLATSPEQRYGTHFRKPIAPLSKKKLDQETNLVYKKKAVTVEKLISFFGLEEHTEKLMQQITTGKHNQENVVLGPKTALNDVDIVSEAETGAGLELPVRLDFQLASSKDMNYWKSHDFIFFLLKQANNFYPVVAYPDFIKIFEYHDQIKLNKGSSSVYDAHEPDGYLSDISA